MFERWRPVGDRCHVIRVEQPDVHATLDQVRRILLQLRA
jgi:hypothetical protein